MEISLLLMQQIAELFLMIFMGYVIVKAGLLKGEDSKVISKIVLYLIIPCVIINAFQVDYTSEKVQGLLLAFAASVMLQVLLLIIVWSAGRLMGLNEVEKASVYYSNAGNLIIPIVTFVLGKDWVLYGCVFMSVQIVFIWSHGKCVLSREQGNIDWKKIVLNVKYDRSISGDIFIFYKDPPAGGFKPDIWLCGKHDRSGQHDRNRYADRGNELKEYFYQCKSVFYYLFKIDCSSCCIADPFKGKRICRIQRRRKGIAADRIFGSAYTFCIHGYSNVSGVWK